MQKVIGVKSPQTKKVHFYVCFDELKIGTPVIVETEFGEAFGHVCTAPREIDSQDENKILRVATERDIKQNNELSALAQKAMQVTKEKIKKLGLDMKVVSSEYTFDGSKVIIEFSADERVDFRELLKELASALKVRIELRQVGQRDEVKVKGGIGPCGQICCCTRFLNDFEHVTVKMAKNQGLSLSPTKISGLCGRLMCCLGYENPVYEEILKRMPKINSEVNTPKGRGTVTYNDILRERVSVKVKNGEDNFTIYDFALEELEQKTKSENKIERPKAEKPQKEDLRPSERVEKSPAGEKKRENVGQKNRHHFKKKEGKNNGISNNKQVH